MDNQQYIEDLRANLCTDIKARRKELGLSQTDMVKLVGISQKHLSNVENGLINVGIDTLLLLAHQLDLRVLIKKSK